MTQLIKGERVKVVEFHVEELVNRTGIVTGFAHGSGQFIKVEVPGHPNDLLGTDEWFFTRDELEPLAVSRSQARREAVQRNGTIR